jgi:hypothetical protein
VRKFKPQTAERFLQVKELYKTSWSRLVEDAHEANPHLLPEDAFDCVASLAAKLSVYPDHLKLTESAFANWAKECLSSTVFLHGLIRECGPAVRRSIRVFLTAQCGGLGVDDSTVDQITSSTWLWALKNVDALLKPGTARLPTRLAAQAKWQVRAWKSKQIDFSDRHDYMCDSSSDRDAA